MIHRPEYGLPGETSCLPLVTVVVTEICDDWLTNRICLSTDGAWRLVNIDVGDSEAPPNGRELTRRAGFAQTSH